MATPSKSSTTPRFGVAARAFIACSFGIFAGASSHASELASERAKTADSAREAVVYTRVTDQNFGDVSRYRYRIEAFDEDLGLIASRSVGRGPVVAVSPHAAVVACVDYGDRAQQITLFDAHLAPICAPTSLSADGALRLVGDDGVFFTPDGRIGIECAVVTNDEERREILWFTLPRGPSGEPVMALALDSARPRTSLPLDSKVLGIRDQRITCATIEGIARLDLAGQLLRSARFDGYAPFAPLSSPRAECARLAWSVQPSGEVLLLTHAGDVFRAAADELRVRRTRLAAAALASEPLRQFRTLGSALTGLGDVVFEAREPGSSTITQLEFFDSTTGQRRTIVPLNASVWAASVSGRIYFQDADRRTKNGHHELVRFDLRNRTATTVTTGPHPDRHQIITAIYPLR